MTGLVDRSICRKIREPRRAQVNPLLAIEVDQFGDIGTGDERLRACAGDNQSPHRGVARHIAKQRVELGDHGRVQGVEFVGAIEGNEADAVVADIEQEGRKSHAEI